MMNLSEVVKKGEKRYSANTYRTNIAGPQDFHRIPTGIFALDYCIGGGFPIGVTSSIYGPPGGGKTLVLSRLSAGAQQICWKCYQYHWDCTCKAEPVRRKVVWVTTELMDLDWYVTLGADLGATTIVEPDSGEQAIDIIAECLAADDCGLVILDSLAMLTPEAEIEASASDDQVAQQARLISRAMRRLKTILIRQKKRGHGVSWVVANQVRAKIGGFSRGPMEEVPGGFTSKHDWHLMFRIAQQKSDDQNKETELPNNAKFRASLSAMTNKRKIFTLAGSAEFFVTVSDSTEYVVGTINDYRTALQYADAAGLIGRTPWSFKGEQFATQGALLESWYDLPKFLSAKKFIIDHYVARARSAQT